jgi:hypothetical protein
MKSKAGLLLATCWVSVTFCSTLVAQTKMVDLISKDWKGPIASVTYFKALPGKIETYSNWLDDVGKPVDDWAVEHGAFESVKTYVNPDPNAPWTHMRVFTFKNREQQKGMAKVMDAAHKAMYPDEAKREAALGHKDDLRVALGGTIMQILK